MLSARLRLAALLSLLTACGAPVPATPAPRAPPHAALDRSAAPLPAALAPAGFLLGAWAGPEDSERWSFAGSSLVGVGFSVKDNKTQSFEVMFVQEHKGSLRFTALPDGARSVPFPLRDREGGRLTFANPAHDFPKRILYRRDGADLAARIEDDTRGVDFAFAPAKIERAPALEQADLAFAANTWTYRRDGWVRGFDPEGAMWRDGVGRIQGLAAIGAAMEKTFANANQALSWQPSTSGLSPARDLGFTAGEWSLTDLDGHGERGEIAHGAYVSIWKAQPDGSFKVLFDTAEPEDAPAEPPAPTTETPPSPSKPRLTSLIRLTRIQARPKVEEAYLGHLGYGSSITLRSTELVPGEGCAAGFYAVEPRGYVCAGPTVSLAPPPHFTEIAASLAASPGPLPYRYAYSDDTPIYNRIPTLAEWTRLEPGYGPSRARRPHQEPSPYDDLAVLDPIPAVDSIPSFLAGGAPASDEHRGLFIGQVPPGSMLSFTRAFASEGRTYLLTTERQLVPADRVRVFRRSDFHGTRLGGDVQLPMAWMRGSPKPRHRRLPGGAFEKTGSTWPVRTQVHLTGASAVHGHSRYLETADRDTDGQPLYLAEADATVMEALDKPPIGVAPDQKWILVSLGQGTLVAYEGKTPVYATLISPGAGGAPEKGKHTPLGTTPLGTYSITYKHRQARMSHDKGEHPTHYIADVPHTQYFNPPFALHAAYWHERFGDATSAGCINVSPIDAEALFQWSDPPVPDEWQGAAGAGMPENGKTTVIVVRR